MRFFSALLACLIGLVAAVIACASPASALPPPPDLGLSHASIFSIAHGQSAYLSVNVTGVFASTDAELTITLPAAIGATLVSASGNNGAATYICALSVPGTYTCDLTALSGGSALINILISSAADTSVGATGVIGLSIEPAAGPDTDQSNNSAAATATISGASDLQPAIGPSPTMVPVGSPVILTATVFNAGPDPATNAVVRLTAQSNPASGLFTFLAFDSPNVTTVNGGVQWSIGTLEVGSTATLTVTITATEADAEGEISMSASSDNVDPICENRACLFGANLVAAPAVVVETSVVSTSVSSTTDSATDAPSAATSAADALANTGSSTGGQAALGVVLLLVGSGALYGSRRRLAISRRH
jgi:LPXTG-motif cell wall-anchored protein